MPKVTQLVNRETRVQTASKSFPGGSVSKASAWNAGDPSLIPGLERSPGEGNGNTIWYSWLENPLGRGAWWATVHGVTRVKHNLATKPPPTYLSSPSLLCCIRKNGRLGNLNRKLFEKIDCVSLFVLPAGPGGDVAPAQKLGQLLQWIHQCCGGNCAFPKLVSEALTPSVVVCRGKAFVNWWDLDEVTRGQRRRWWEGIANSMDRSLRNSGRQWRTGKPGMLQSVGLQRVGCDLVTEQQWCERWGPVMGLVSLCATWRASSLSLHGSMQPGGRGLQAQEAGVCKPGRGPSPRIQTRPQPPEPWERKLLLLEPRGLWDSVTTALQDEDSWTLSWVTAPRSTPCDLPPHWDLLKRRSALDDVDKPGRRGKRGPRDFTWKKTEAWPSWEGAEMLGWKLLTTGRPLVIPRD